MFGINKMKTDIALLQAENYKLKEALSESLGMAHDEIALLNNRVTELELKLQGLEVKKEKKAVGRPRKNA